MLIVKYGVEPISSSSQLFVPPPPQKNKQINKLRNSTVIWLCALQDNLEVQVLHQVLLENNLFTLFEKNCYTRYLLLNVLIINFLVLCFASNFILIVGANISWNTSYFKSFWVWNKVLKYKLIQFWGISYILRWFLISKFQLSQSLKSFQWYEIFSM